MRTFVVGDIHGAHKALRQCFERSGFNKEQDRLIALGDVCDGWPEVKQCIDELLGLRHLVYILGNHDHWTLTWAQTGKIEDLWQKQGGAATLSSYAQGPMPDAHVKFLAEAPRYLVENNKLFIHAGFNWKKPLADQDQGLFLWDRKLIVQAFQTYAKDPEARLGEYGEIFLGHTPTLVFHVDKPLHLCNVWALDTGAGWSGKLSIMNLETKEYWQSDPSPGLYPGVEMRSKG